MPSVIGLNPLSGIFFFHYYENYLINFGIFNYLFSHVIVIVNLSGWWLRKDYF